MPCGEAVKTPLPRDCREPTCQTISTPLCRDVIQRISISVPSRPIRVFLVERVERFRGEASPQAALYDDRKCRDLIAWIDLFRRVCPSKRLRGKEAFFWRIKIQC
jgi:hypothetical protein